MTSISSNGIRGLAGAPSGHIVFACRGQGAFGLWLCRDGIKAICVHSYESYESYDNYTNYDSYDSYDSYHCPSSFNGSRVRRWIPLGSGQVKLSQTQSNQIKFIRTKSKENPTKSGLIRAVTNADRGGANGKLWKCGARKLRLIKVN